MSRLIRRGRVFFLILATLIVVDRASSLVLALIGDTENLSIWQSILLPVLVILGVVSLWRGETGLRRLMAAWALLHGGINLLIFGFLIYRMAAVTPPEQAGFLLNVSAMLFGFSLLHAGFYIFVGLALLLSRSLKAFFNHQSQTAETPLNVLTDRLLSIGKMDRASRSVRQLACDYETRTRYPVLTREILESLDDIDLVDAVVDYVQLKVNDDYEREFEIVSSLPRGFQAAYSTWWVQAEVLNGGFHQYFYNRGVDWAFMALEGYKFFGADELASLMARAIEVYLQEEPEQLKHRTDNPLQMIEQYVKARNVSTLPELDSSFYEADDDGALAMEYIRAHIDVFVAD